MVPETLVSSAFNHLTQLAARVSFIGTHYFILHAKFSNLIVSFCCDVVETRSVHNAEQAVWRTKRLLCFDYIMLVNCKSVRLPAVVTAPAASAVRKQSF
jgi:hypothetical protein